MAQIILTFITEINNDKRVQLEDLLEQVQANLASNQYVPFASLTRLHFASFFILDDKNGKFRPCLVFENNFDGPLDNYLAELLNFAGPGLHEIYSCCSDYPAGTYDETELTAYLKAHIVRPNTYHIGNVGRSAARIREESGLLTKIQSYLDTLSGQNNDASVIRQDIQQYVKNDSSLSWAIGDIGPRQTLAERLVPWVKLLAAPVILVVILIALLILFFIPTLIFIFFLVGLFVVILRLNERGDISRSPQLNTRHTQILNEQEDLITQNHLISLTLVKPGWFRLITLRAVLWLVNLVARTANKGELNGIPSIHFAHWSLINNGQRLLFLSNYDGSWISYLDDFIDKASYGLTAVWTNTVGFPPTRFLVLEGAKHEAEFKAFARASQSQANVWYSAYPDLTVQNIDKDSLIREELFKPLDENAAKNWLQLF